MCFTKNFSKHMAYYFILLATFLIEQNFNFEELQFIHFCLLWAVLLMSYLRNICLTKFTEVFSRSFPILFFSIEI